MMVAIQTQQQFKSQTPPLAAAAAIVALEDAAANALVRGSYLDALVFARECLQQQHAKDDTLFGLDTSNVGVVVLQTRLLHQLFASPPDDDSQPTSPQYKLVLDTTKNEPDSVDRAAAILLQSWYELSASPFNSATTNQQHNSAAGGRVYLETFFETYSQKPCSPELAVLLTQFLCATNQVSDAMELASEILYHIMIQQQQQQQNERSLPTNKSQLPVVRDLFVLLLTNLFPYQRATNVRRGLLRFSHSHWTSMQWNDRKNTTTMAVAVMNKDSVRACLEWLTHSAAAQLWSDKESFQDVVAECKRLLDNMLVVVDGESKEHANTISCSPNHETRRLVPKEQNVFKLYKQSTTLLLHRWNQESIRHYIQRLVQYVRVVMAKSLQLADENRATSAFIAWMLWASWKRRRRMQLPNAAMQLLFKPLQEVLAAIVPTRR
jgi:hypothetical protein